MKSESIQVFDSQGEAYKRAFQIFLDHTDQKRNAKRFLQKLVDGLPNRNVFIDAGAGNGEVTKAFAGAFCHTIAIEPNPHLLTQLKQTIPQAEAIAAPILAAEPKAQGDFVLCSHTLYYIPAEEWLAHLDRLVSWMSPAGVTVVCRAESRYRLHGDARSFLRAPVRFAPARSSVSRETWRPL